MRTRLLRTAALGVTLGLGGLVLGAGPASASVDTGSDEIALAGMINAERAAAGLAPLAIDGRLFDSARSWSAVQAAAGDLSHDASFLAGNRPEGAGAVAENVAYNTSAATVHARLMPARRTCDAGSGRVSAGEVELGHAAAVDLHDGERAQLLVQHLVHPRRDRREQRHGGRPAAHLPQVHPGVEAPGGVARRLRLQLAARRHGGEADDQRAHLAADVEHGPVARAVVCVPHHR